MYAQDQKDFTIRRVCFSIKNIGIELTKKNMPKLVKKGLENDWFIQQELDAWDHHHKLKLAKEAFPWLKTRGLEYVKTHFPGSLAFGMENGLFTQKEILSELKKHVRWLTLANEVLSMIREHGWQYTLRSHGSVIVFGLENKIFTEEELQKARDETKKSKQKKLSPPLIIF